MTTWIESSDKHQYKHFNKLVLEILSELLTEQETPNLQRYPDPKQHVSYCRRAHSLCSFCLFLGLQKGRRSRELVFQCIFNYVQIRDSMVASPSHEQRAGPPEVAFSGCPLAPHSVLQRANL